MEAAPVTVANLPAPEDTAPTATEESASAPGASVAEVAPATALTEPSAAAAAPTSEPIRAAPSPSVTRPPFGVGRYTVARGDTMFSIARKAELNLGVLSAINNIGDPSSVKAGQTLYIPAQPGTVYVASKGDTLQSIADKYQAKPEVIRDANQLDKDVRLESGQLVLIPGSVQASAGSIQSLASVQPQALSSNPGLSPLPAPKSAQAPPTPPAVVAAMARAPQGGGGDMMIWPVIGPLSTNYSPTHRGLDIVANQGVPIKSALAGRVVGAAEGDGPYGWYVMVEHGGAFSTVYAHLSKIRVKVGDVVDKGQIVGEVGRHRAIDRRASALRASPEQRPDRSEAVFALGS